MSRLEINFTDEWSLIKDILHILGGKRKTQVLSLISDGRDWTIAKMASRLNCKIANLSIQVKELEQAGLIVKHLSKTIGSNSKIIKPAYDEILIKFGD